MSVFRRIGLILGGLASGMIGLVMVLDPNDSKFMTVMLILATGLAIRGIKDIVFYFTMAKHMVGGKLILFQGVIVLDFALFTASLSDIPKFYILLYLVGIHAFTGAVEVLRAMESKKTVEGPWKLKFFHGVVDFVMALSCLVFIRYTNTAVVIYGIGLVYSSVIRIIGAFRKTTFIMID